MGGKSGSQTVGWRYYFGIQSGIGRGPLNEVREIKVGDKRAWIGSVKQNGRIYIDKPELFGGEEKEGGIQGNMDFYFGDAAQTIAGTDLETMIGAPQPGFRRMMTSFFDGLVCMNNPYPKTWKFRVRRTSAGWDGSVFLPDYVTIFLPWEEVPEEPINSGIINNFEGGGGFFVTMFRRLAKAAAPVSGIQLDDYEVINGANACGPAGRSAVYAVADGHVFSYDAVTGEVLENQNHNPDYYFREVCFYSNLTGKLYATDTAYGRLTAFSINPLVKGADISYYNELGEMTNVLAHGLTSDGRYLYLGSAWNFAASDIAKIDLLTGTVTNFKHYTNDLPLAILCPPDENAFLYILFGGNTSLTAFHLDKVDASTGQTLARVDLYSKGGNGWNEICLAPNNDFMYVPCMNGLYLINLATFEVHSFAPNPKYGVDAPVSIQVTRDGRTIYVGYGNTDGLISKYNAFPDLSYVGDIATQASCSSTRSTLSGDGNRIYFTDGALGTKGFLFDIPTESAVSGGSWPVNFGAGFIYISKPVLVETYGRFIHAMNPAHIIYECLTNREWGRGLSAARIDAASFTSAAMTLCGEEFGLCLKWTRKDTIGSFVQQVLDHIGAVVYTSRTTGLLVLKLIRSDYDINAIPFFTTETGLKEIREASIAVKGSSVNQVQVTYHDPITDEDRTVKVTSQGALKAAGGIINSTSKSYPGLPVPSLALRVAQRDLRSASTNLRRFTLVLDRRASAVHPGEVIAIQDPKRGISKMALRVGKVDTGTLLNGDITLTCVQDVFGLPTQSFAANTPPVWQRPETFPSIFKQKVIEVPYYLIARTQTPADLATITESAGFIGALNAQGSTVNQGFQIAVRDSAPTADDQKVDGTFYIEFDV